MNFIREHKVAVVLPCYKVRNTIAAVLQAIGNACDFIYVVDDGCPEQSGAFVEENISDKRVKVLRHTDNEGVGGAVITGYLQAVKDGATIVVKIDGDGQMNPALLPLFIEPIIAGEADYVKGNRFYNLDDVRGMPCSRLVGNAALSFMTKLSSGYWNIFDPTNGYTAIQVSLLKNLPLNKIARRYFFESDMLFRLNILRAKVVDVPIRATYGLEVSNLKIGEVIFPFLIGHLRNFFKRIFYNYFLRDFSLASLELFFGLILIGFGGIFGGIQWMLHSQAGTYASTGTVMLAALSILIGILFLLSAINYDIANVPQHAIHRKLSATEDNTTRNS